MEQQKKAELEAEKGRRRQLENEIKKLREKRQSAMIKIPSLPTGNTSSSPYESSAYRSPTSGGHGVTSGGYGATPAASESPSGLSSLWEAIWGTTSPEVSVSSPSQPSPAPYSPTLAPIQKVSMFFSSSNWIIFGP